jgi:acetylornithine deacetylase
MKGARSHDRARTEESVDRRVVAWVEDNREEVVSFLQTLVGIPSVTGREGRIQDFIATELQGMGLSVDKWEPDWEALKTHPAYVEVDQGYEDRPNVVATLKGSGGGRSLLFNGHVDVIPAGPPEGWVFGPWSAALEGGRIHGRGSSDMKAGLAAMTIAVKAIVATGVRLHGDVILEYTVDEELSGNGTLACVQRGYAADAGICCETSSMRIQPASIGRIWFEITVRGKAAGIQRHWEGVSAIEKGYVVTQAVAGFEEWRFQHVSHALYPVAREAIPCTVGVFESGSYHSAFPDVCVLKGSMATVPGEDSDTVKREFTEFIISRSGTDSWLAEYPPEIRFVGYFAEPSEIPVESAIVECLSRNYRAMSGAEPVISGREGAADTRHLNSYGATPTVIFGPGRSEQMHANNEWVAVDDLVAATKVLAATILDWCGHGDE